MIWFSRKNKEGWGKNILRLRHSGIKSMSLGSNHREPFNPRVSLGNSSELRLSFLICKVRPPLPHLRGPLWGWSKTFLYGARLSPNTGYVLLVSVFQLGKFVFNSVLFHSLSLIFFLVLSCIPHLHCTDLLREVSFCLSLHLYAFQFFGHLFQGWPSLCCGRTSFSFTVVEPGQVWEVFMSHLNVAKCWSFLLVESQTSWQPLVWNIFSMILDADLYSSFRVSRGESIANSGPWMSSRPSPTIPGAPGGQSIK